MKDDISKEIWNKNFGVGCPGGVEVVAHSLRDVLESQIGSKEALLKIDFRNAFNLIDRNAFVRATNEKFPALSQWTQWCYGAPSVLLYDHDLIINSARGVQQGDRWALCIFAVAFLFWWKKSINLAHVTINGTWTTVECVVRKIS